MRHVIVRRVVIALAVALAGAAAGFAWLAGRPAAEEIARVASGDGVGPPGGEALFERHCAACHEAPGLAATLTAAPDTAAASAALRAFLDGHVEAGEVGPAEIRAIVEFLAAGGEPEAGGGPDAGR
ncbi:MAG TPA: hypothetical protein VFD43_03790 [Planctomycetota bacterium]|nr:hypothetical protein [Planctomycetota bacterium]